MADGKGFQVIVKINLPPEQQYHSGHSLIVQADTPGEVQDLIADAIELNGAQVDNIQDQAHFILTRFIEFAQQGAVQASLAVPQPSGVEQRADGVRPAGPGDTDSPPVVTGSTPDDLASPALLKVVAKKTNTPLEELEGYTTEAAKALLKGVK